MTTGIMSRAFRNLSRRKIRALLVIIAIGFCMSIMLVLPAGIAANQAATENLTGNLGDIITQTEAAINQTLTQIQCTLTQSLILGGGMSISPNGGVPVAGGSFTPFNESNYQDIADISSVAAIEPMLQVVKGHNETAIGVVEFTITIPDYIITGVLLNSSLIDNYPILPTNITAGRNLQAGETGSVVLSQNASAYFNAEVGDTINILGKDFEVVGIYSPTGTSDSQLVYMNLADAQEITDNEGMVTQLNVFADSASDVTSVSNNISSSYPELNVNTAQERLSQIQQVQSMYDAQLEKAQATMNQTQAQARGEIAIAVTATSIIVLFVMLYTVRERTKEIGTLKAIGASNRIIMSQFLVEGILLSLFAGVVGVGIGTIAAPFLSSVLLPAVGGPSAVGVSGGMAFNTGNTQTSLTNAFAVSPELMLIGLGVSVLLGAIGSLYPAWRAAKIRPAEAMRYE
jgi:ABC-type antimicrobial peptide transport system permease subunit